MERADSNRSGCRAIDFASRLIRNFHTNWTVQYYKVFTRSKNDELVATMSERNSQLTESLKFEARRLGFSLIGIAPAVTPLGFSHFSQWLDSGCAGEMHYLPKRRAAYEHPRHVLENVRSLAIMGLSYDSGVESTSQPGFGRISRYAWGNADYHDLIFEKLNRLGEWVATAAPEAKIRGVVDTAPLLEREFAQLAGLGWQGKNTMLINPGSGSYFFLAALLLDIELVYDEPHTTDHCGEHI